MPFDAAPIVKANFFTLCWGAFVIFWWITAIRVKPLKQPMPPGERLFHLAYSVLMILLLLGKIHASGINTRIIPYGAIEIIISHILALLGVVIMIWARTILGSNWSGDVVLRENHELIQRGPYRFVRHPIYTGLLMLIAGTGLALGTPAGVLAFAVYLAGTWWKLKREEALLTTHFPDAYPAYKARTKALIPGIL